MAAEPLAVSRRARLEARRSRLVVLRGELAAVTGAELAKLSASDARRLGRRYFKLGELVSRLDKRLA